MATWTGTVIDARIYKADLKTRIQQWLDAHINETEYLPYWLQIGGAVDVFCAPPDELPMDTLSKPRIQFDQVGDQAEYVIGGTNGVYMADYERHNMRYRFTIMTDAATGGAMANAGVASALAYCFASYREELELLGMQVGMLEDGSEQISEDLCLTTQELGLVYVLQCRTQRTIALTMAACALTGMGQLTFVAGSTVAHASALQVRMQSGTRNQPIHLTVYGKNQDAEQATATATLDIGIAGGQCVSLLPENVGDKFTEVLSATILPGDGAAGVSWTIENVPETL